MRREKRGAIYSLEHYAQGKLVQSSSWKLPRGITPSDVDLVFDNDGALLLCEFSSATDDWGEVSRGQRWLYESFCKLGCTAALLKHSVEPPAIIDSKRDVDSFSLMKFEDGEIIVGGPFPGRKWPGYVERQWYPAKVAA